MTRRAGLATVAAIGLAIGLAGAALAYYTPSAAATHTVATATLQPPSNPSAAHGTCTILVTDRVVVSWTATPSTWADGYRVLRATASGGPYASIATVGPATTTYTDSSVAFSKTYWYRVEATKAAWRSPQTASVSITTRSSLCIL